MKVVLRDDVEGIGRRGDVVEVARGFARNYLLPARRALRATPGAEAQAAAMRRSRDLKDARARDAAETRAQALAGVTLVVEARAGAGGRLFGSVGATDIVQAARQQVGVELDRHGVLLDEPIKELGRTEVTLELHRGIVATVGVEVRAPG